MSGLVARCPRCGARAPEDAARCAGCGRSLADDVVVLETGVPDAPVAAAGPGGRGTRRRAAAVAVAVAAVLVGAGLRVVSGDDGGPPAVAEALPAVDGRTGVHLLALTDDGLVSVDVDDDVVLPVDVPASGRPAAVVERRGGAVVVSGGRAWLVRPSGRVQDIGGAALAFAAEAPDRVWLGDDAGVREVTLDGAVVRGPVDVPATAAAGGGLVVNASGGVQLHDAATGALVRRVGDLPPLIDAAGDWVVTADREELRCEVVVVDMTDGRRRTIPLLPYDTCLQGRSAMSADGRRLVLPAAEYVHGAGTRHGGLVVVDVVRRAARRVPRTQRPIPLFSSPTWTASGAWCFWVDPVGEQAIAGYRVGSEGAVAVRPTGLGPARVRGLWVLAG